MEKGTKKLRSEQERPVLVHSLFGQQFIWFCGHVCHAKSAFMISVS